MRSDETETTSPSSGSPAADDDDERLLAAARRGDAGAFDRLAAPYRRQLHVHCYRMLGSLQDAEDALQETLLAAWRGLGGFEGRSSLRTWLYRIATNACLRLAGRRPRRVLSSDAGPAWTDVHELGEFVEGDPTWLEPWPDTGAPGAGGPDDPAASYERRENVELAFVAALQALPANQRAVLILREVLELPAAEVAGALDTTVASVNSALQRARRTVNGGMVAGTQAGELRALGERGRRELVGAFVAAFERADIGALVDLLAADVRFTMPPLRAWFSGPADVARFLAERSSRLSWRARPTTANGQIAVACYQRDADDGRFRLGALPVLTLRDGRIARIDAFLDPGTHRWFDLPTEWPEEPDHDRAREESPPDR
jgi:RNA polymerase sigma-70 factor (ECF subfamily)